MKKYKSVFKEKNEKYVLTYVDSNKNVFLLSTDGKDILLINKETNAPQFLSNLAFNSSKLLNLGPDKMHEYLYNFIIDSYKKSKNIEIFTKKLNDELNLKNNRLKPTKVI